MKIFEVWIFYFVNAFDLPHQQFRVADQLQGPGATLDRIFESSDQSLIFGEIVGLVTKIFAKLSNFASRLILNDDSIAGRPRISAGSAVAVRDEVVFWSVAGISAT